MLNRLLNRDGKDLSKYCVFIKDDGQRCEAFHQKNSEYCVFHDPKKEDQRKEARSQGGRKRSYEKIVLTETGELIDTPEKVLLGLSEVIANLKQQDNTTNTARALIDGYRAIMEVLSGVELEQKIAEIEEKLKVRGV